MEQSKGNQDTEHNKHASANHVLKYTGIFGGVQGITMLVSIVRNKLVAVLIGQVGLGIIDIFNRTLDLVGNTTNFGVSFSAVQHISSLYGKTNDEEIKHYVCVVRSWALLTALFGMAICLIFSPIISLITFGDLSRTATFCMLAPIVGMMAINGGEMAILKGLRRLRRIVVVSTLIVLTTLVSTVPFYWRWGISGIVPALLLSNVCGMLIQLLYTHKVIPWRVSFSKDVFGEGYDMIRLGVAYILAGVLGSGAEMAVRVLLRHWGDFNDVGLYAAGTTLIVAYAGLIFKALDTDYFPRLSSICNDVPKANAAICQQLEVCVLLIIPLLILFMLAVPFIVPLLYTGKFVPAVPMVICASFYLFFKSISLPISYLPLAKGDSTVYLTMEACYDVAFVVLMTIGYALWNLLGAGIAISTAYLFDLLLVSTYYHHHYGFRFTTSAKRIIAVQGSLIVCTLVLAFQTVTWVKYGLGGTAFAISTLYSFYVLRRETTFVTQCKSRLSKMLRR